MVNLYNQNPPLASLNFDRGARRGATLAFWGGVAFLARMITLKVVHILCVMGWMTSIFAVPRALIYWRREWDRIDAFGPLGDLTIRLYRFSLGLGVIAIITGLWLGIAYHGMADWVWLKLAMVAVLAAHYGWTGWLVLRARKGVFGESDRYLRIFNELSVLGAIAVLWVVVAKPGF